MRKQKTITTQLQATDFGHMLIRHIKNVAWLKRCQCNPHDQLTWESDVTVQHKNKYLNSVEKDLDLITVLNYIWQPFRIRYSTCSKD